ncbi:MAG: hypothetical protein K0R47_4526, partial [Brevibacillus sp.]|nr:hypothetical protein [Brevibacillus sp.]
MNYPPIPVTFDDRTAYTPPVTECGEEMIPLSTLSSRVSVYPAYYH